MTDSLLKIDHDLSGLIYDNIGKSSVLSKVVYFLGLLPYEIYVLPGMFVAIMGMIAHQSYVPLQLHLLPHWFAFSVAQYIKSNIKRTRPGCLRKDGLISKNHCEGKTRDQSFCSGHTLICVALTTSLYVFLADRTVSNKRVDFLNVSIDFNNPNLYKPVQVGAILVCTMTALHRVSLGYHYVSDVICGAFIGVIIGLVVYRVMDKAVSRCKKENDSRLLQNIFVKYVSKWVVLVLCGFALVHFFIFKLPNLAAIKH